MRYSCNQEVITQKSLWTKSNDGQVKMMWMLMIILLLDCCASITALSCQNNSIPEWKTNQSSTYKTASVDLNSEKALDGNKTLCANTNELPNSWWSIDLLGVYNISLLKIYNKAHTHSDINGCRIHIGNSRDNNGTANSVCNHNITNFETDTWNTIKCDTHMLGRYVTVFSPAKVLVLCEVEICGTKQDSPFQLIKENKTWVDALEYCRERNKELVSILDEESQAWAELEAENADTPFVWLGLRYTCTLEFWFWVDDNSLDFTHWAPNGDARECDMSGAMKTQGDFQWFSLSNDETFNFICVK